MAESGNTCDRATLYELQKWLEKLYGEDSCPTLNPDDHNIELLRKIKSKNEKAEKDVKEEIKTKKNLIEYYNTQSEEMENLISSESVSLSDETIKQIESVAELAVKMNLEAPDKTNFLLGICDMKKKHLKKQEQKLKDQFNLSSLSKKIVKIEKQNEILKRDLGMLEKTVHIQDSNKIKLSATTSLMKEKSQEYKHLSEHFENNIIENGYDPSLKHSSLVEKAESVQLLAEQVSKVVAKLESYKALPPNECLVQVEVEKRKKELELLEKEFSASMEALENAN